MTKIKNFRLTLRPREIARWLKKERGMPTTPDLELSIEQVIKEGKAWIEPAAVYSTLTRSAAEKMTAVIFPNKSIAVSILAVSIGTAIGRERAAAQADPIREALLAALEQEALAQAVLFAVRLLQEQAKDEDCDMSSPVCAQTRPLGQEELSIASEPSLSLSLATLVGIQRIGVSLETDSLELPPHARVAWLFWTPAGKSSSRATAAKASASTEKVAV
jgi:hypothetical protein